MAHGALENAWRAEPKDAREQHQLDDLRKAHGEATLELRARKAGVSVCWARARRDRLKSGRNCAGKVWTRRFAAGSVWDIASTAFSNRERPIAAEVCVNHLKNLRCQAMPFLGNFTIAVWKRVLSAFRKKMLTNCYELN
jgi:hypothetical protein